MHASFQGCMSADITTIAQEEEEEGAARWGCYKNNIERCSGNMTRIFSLDEDVFYCTLLDCAFRGVKTWSATIFGWHVGTSWFSSGSPVSETRQRKSNSTQVTWTQPDEHLVSYITNICFYWIPHSKMESHSFLWNAHECLQFSSRTKMIDRCVFKSSSWDMWLLIGWLHM